MRALHFHDVLVAGLTVGAACSLSLVKDILTNAISELPEEKTKVFHAVLQQLRTLGGEQIRNVAVCCALLAITIVTNCNKCEIASDYM